MNYDHLPIQTLLRNLVYRDESIKRLKRDASISVYKAIANELEEERRFRYTLEENNLLLLKELARYQKLVGDWKEPEEVDNL